MPASYSIQSAPVHGEPKHINPAIRFMIPVPWLQRNCLLDYYGFNIILQKYEMKLQVFFRSDRKMLFGDAGNAADPPRSFGPVTTTRLQVHFPADLS